MTAPTRVVVKSIAWDCGKGHLHKSKAAAERCMKKVSRLMSKRQSVAKALDAALMRRAGMTYKAIGAAFGVGPARGRDIVRKGERLSRNTG